LLQHPWSGKLLARRVISTIAQPPCARATSLCYEHQLVS
jgi:hypothetical protein